MDFESSNLSHSEKEIKIVPKFKKKFKSEVYVKRNNKNNSLF